jgi:hypothetical protein
MQCRDARELFDSFLGEELLVETNHDLLRHLESCVDCRAELDARSRLRSGLKQAFMRAPDLKVRPEFATELAGRLRTTAPAGIHRKSPTRWLALAASLLLVAGAGAYLFGGRSSSVARQAAGDHQNCAVKFALAEPPISLDEAAARYDPAYARLKSSPADEVRTGAGMLHVADRHSCVFDHRRFGHVVYRLDDHLVSVLMTNDASNADSRQISWLPDVNGLAMASLHVPGHVVYVVSDLQNPAFRQVAESLADPLSKLAARAEPYVLWALRRTE